jgi:hypothetical protein
MIGPEPPRADPGAASRGPRALAEAVVNPFLLEVRS